MPLDFPASPITGATYTAPNGTIWVWDGAKWANGVYIGTAYAPINSPVLTGNPQSVTPAPGDADTSVATTAFVSAAVAPSFNGVGRNLVHNPLFAVAQRGAASVGSGGYPVDRWPFASSLDTSSAQQFVAPDGTRGQINDEAVSYFVAGPVTGNAAAGSYTFLYQPIEDVRRLAGKTITVSFWALANSGTPKLGVGMTQVFGSGGSPSAGVDLPGQSVTVGNTWARYSLTFAVPSIIGKTLGTTPNTNYTTLSFWFSSGATQNVRAGNIGVQSWSWNLWGVQLEIGSLASPLEKPDPRYDLSNCQRMFCTFPVLVPAVAAPSNIVFPTTMRVAPIVAGGGAGFVTANLSASAVTVSQTTAAAQTLTFTSDL